MASDKTSTIHSLLFKAWRERWSDIQWGIQLKSILPRGCSGDVYNLSNLILEHALVSPIPNSLMLSYLRHSLAAQTISHGSLLEAIVNQSDMSKLKSRPHCTSALLDLIDLTKKLVSKRSKPEECMNLNSTLLKTLSWLLRFLLSVLEANQMRNSSNNGAGAGQGQNNQTVLESFDNAKKCFNILKTLYEDEFLMNLLYVARIEDKDSHAKMATTCKNIDNLINTKTSTIPKEFKSFYSSEVILGLRSLDPLKNESKQISIANEMPSFVHAIQPMLVFEALFHPTSDLSNLSQYLNCLGQILGNVSFSDLVHECLRSLLLSISHKEGLEPLKVDAFILVRLPNLLEKMYKLHKGNDTTPLKTPTDLYKAFDKLLNNESLLDSIDLRCKCNIIEILLRIISKSPTALMTETEKDDVMKKRKSRIDNPKVAILANMHAPGNIRNFELTLKAEDKLDSILKSFQTSDSKPESVEHLISILKDVIKSESFDMWQAVTSATSKLESLLSFLLKFNQQSQESQGESIKNSLNRAALFDMTFLMLVYSAQCFGIQVIKDIKGHSNEFMLKWINEFMVESSGSSAKDLYNNDNNVDNLMQQLANGELRTQVVKWNVECCKIHLAMKEIIHAKAQKLIANDLYEKMLSTMCSKLCALPVCTMAWIINYRKTMPASKIDLNKLAQEFAKLAEKALMANEVPHAKERVAMMNSIMKKFMAQSGTNIALIDDEQEFSYDPKTAPMLNAHQVDNSLQDVLLDVWNKICSKGYVDIEAAWKLKYLYKTGGSFWMISVLIESLLHVTYQDDLAKKTETLRSIMHLDIEQTTLALLLHVMPKYLQYKQHRQHLTDPQGSALAKLLVGCMFTVLSLNLSKKRTHVEAFGDDMPSPKMRKLMQGAHESKESKIEEGNRISEAIGGFFQLLYAIVCCQETHVTPVTHFAFRILEQIALRSSSKSRSRMILQHMSISLVMHLVKVLPNMFTMGIIAKLFDVSASSGRKNMARVMCLLRTVQVKQDDDDGQDQRKVMASHG